MSPLCCPQILRHSPTPFSPPHPRITLSYLLSLQPQSFLPNLTSCPDLDTYFTEKKKKEQPDERVPKFPSSCPPAPPPAPHFTLSSAAFPTSTNGPSSSCLLHPGASESPQWPFSHIPLPGQSPPGRPCGSSFRLYPQPVRFLSPPPTPPGSEPPSSLRHRLSQWLSRASPCFLFSPTTGFQHSSHRVPYAISLLCANCPWLLLHGE